MTYLVDTHVVLWLLGDTRRVPADVLADLAEPSAELLVSAASALEVATKARLGKLDVPRRLLDGWSARIAEIGGTELRITSAHAVLAGQLQWEHRDPFDRLLVAQASLENATLVTTDAAIVGLGGLRVLSW